MQDQNPESTGPLLPETDAKPQPAQKKTRVVKREPAAKAASRRKPVGRKPKRREKPVPAATAPRIPKPKRKAVGRFVVLFRHGLAEEHSLAKPDGDRSLTAEGHAKTKNAARGMAELFPEADTLFSSPLLRAMQTALWLTKVYGDKLKIQVTDALLPGADPARLAELIAGQDGTNVIVVGHEPHLTDTFAHFVGISTALRADLKKAGCIGIRLDERGKGTLEWMLAPRMLRKLG